MNHDRSACQHVKTSVPVGGLYDKDAAPVKNLVYMAKLEMIYVRQDVRPTQF